MNGRTPPIIAIEEINKQPDSLVADYLKKLLQTNLAILGTLKFWSLI